MTTTPLPEFELFTSLRYDPRLRSFPWNTWARHPAPDFLLLPYHFDRLTRAAEQFQWPDALKALNPTGNKADALEALKSLCQECANRTDDPQKPLRIRVVLSKTGALKAESFPTLPLAHDLLHPSTFNPDAPAAFTHPARQLAVFLDTAPTPQSALTAHKTTARAHYDAARARLALAPAAPEEVLLYNPQGDVTEGSIRNVAFWRGGRWVTPDLASGCLAGTVRRWLLEQGRVVEGRIRREDVRAGEWVLLCNGVEGCLLGTICTR